MNQFKNSMIKDKQSLKNLKESLNDYIASIDGFNGEFETIT